VESPPKRLQAAIVSRVKIMAKLNIRRAASSPGRTDHASGPKGRRLISGFQRSRRFTGESIVLRILDKSSIVLDIEKLGFPEDTMGGFRDLIHRPHGIILVTGPTGAERRRPFTAPWKRSNSPDKKIITVEDPVEYQLRGINQIQVKPAIAHFCKFPPINRSPGPGCDSHR